MYCPSARPSRRRRVAIEATNLFWIAFAAAPVAFAVVFGGR